MQTITILGAGWLGLSLAKELKNNNYDVLATYRNSMTKYDLYEANINAIKLDLTVDDIPNEVFYRDIICILIPPSKNDNYVQILEKIAKNNKIANLKQVIFISSTSVYEESDLPKDETSSIKENSTIAQAEKLFKNLKNSCILRFAGLMGEKRYLAKYYNDIVENSQAIVNHIHKDDAVGIIEKIITENIHGIYNICAPLHPTRQTVIENQCKVLNKKEPSFIEGNNHKSKIITSKIDKKIFYMYKYPNPTYFPLIKNQDVF